LVSKQDLDRGTRLLIFAAAAKPERPRHFFVQNDQVGFRGFYGLQQFLSVTHFRPQFPALENI